MQNPNKRLDELNDHFKDLKKRVADLEQELAVERKKNRALGDANRALTKERDNALLLRDSRVWPAAVDYILTVNPWNAIKITYDDFPELGVIQVEMKPIKWTFRQGDLELIVQEEEISHTKTHARN